MFKNRRSRSVVREARRELVARAVLPLIEGLEGRRMLSASLTGSGTLNIHGTGHADDISVSMDAQNADMIDVSVNGNVKTFNAGSVDAIVVKGGAGGDTVEVSDNVTKPATVMGSGGNDSLMAGGGADSLNGGAGNDSLEGGAGDDSLVGGAGNDTCVGGTGNNEMAGGAGNDSLQGGAGDDSLDGGAGNDSLISGTGQDHVDAGKGKDHVDFNPNAGVALNTLPAPVQAGLTTLAQGAAITSVLTFHEDGQTYYGTEVTIAGVNTRIIVDANGSPVTQSPHTPDGGGEDHRAGGYGAVVSVDAPASTITVTLGNEHGPSKQTTFSVTAATAITADGTTIPLGTLTAGEFVSVQADSSAPTTAVAITVIDRHVGGVVTAVDTTANSITLTDGGTSNTYTLNAGATINVNGTAGTLADVTLNSHAGLKLSSLDGTVLTLEDKSGGDNPGGDGGGDSQKHAFGSIAGVDTTANTITLANDGTSTAYNLTATTTVYLNGAVSTLGALPVGAAAGLKLAADGTTVISIEVEVAHSGDGGGGDNHSEDASGPVVSVDTAANTITLLGGSGGTNTTYNLTGTTTVVLDGAPSTLAAIAAGKDVELKLASDGTVLTVLAETPPPPNPGGGGDDGGGDDEHHNVAGSVVSADTAANTITLAGEGGASTTYNLTSSTTINLNGAPSTLTALVAGTKAELQLASDGTTVLTVQAETPEIHGGGAVVSVDTIANTITLADGGRQTTYHLTGTTTITLDDAAGTLSALTTGISAQLNLAADGVTVLSIHAHTPQTPPPVGEPDDVSGPVAGVNTVANTITLKGDGDSTKTYNLTGTTTISLNGAAATLADVTAGAAADLKLAADGVTVLSIQVEVEHNDAPPPPPHG